MMIAWKQFAGNEVKKTARKEEAKMNELRIKCWTIMKELYIKAKDESTRAVASLKKANQFEC